MVLECRGQRWGSRKAKEVVKAESFIGRIVVNMGVLSRGTSPGEGDDGRF